MIYIHCTFQHIEYAAVHRDDSDDDSDDGDESSGMQEPPDGWEDEFGKYEFPDEEDAMTDEGEEGSWEEYDECDIECEDEPHDPLAISSDTMENSFQSKASRFRTTSSYLL